MTGGPISGPASVAPVDDRRPLPPDVLASACTDRVHKDIGRGQAVEVSWTVPNVDRAQMAALSSFDLTPARPCIGCESRATRDHLGAPVCDACYRAVAVAVDDDDGDPS